VCFRTDLKFSRDDAFLISAGNLFHQVGAATLNAQSPYILSETLAPVIVSDWMTSVFGRVLDFLEALLNLNCNPSSLS